MSGRGGSLFAFILKAIGTCLKGYPEFNSMIDFRKRTIFTEVDIDIPIEVRKHGELYNIQHIIRDVSGTTLAQIHIDIENAKETAGDERAYMKSGLVQKIITRLPRRLVLFIFRRILKTHALVKRMSGTVFVTSVSMFSNVPGYIIPYAGGSKSVSFAVGSVTQKPVVRNNAVAAREMINITAMFNHDAVDGAPAARSINRMRKCIEHEYMEL